jgi:DNA polymerase I-like protein with 3'-5' exonuclease and polymerase domains
MSNLVALDLETECAVAGCPGYGGSSKCDHALSPWHSRITVVGVYGETIRKVFRDLGDLRSWLSANGSLRFVGHNFKFDLLHLLARDVVIPLESWIGDTQLAAYVLTDKIPDGWLVDYEAKRKQQPGKHRQAGKHSLKTLAPYHLGVDPFWETENKDDDGYVLRDAEYTYNLFPVLERRLIKLDQYNFYINKQLPWTKLLLRAEARGVQLDIETMGKMEAEMLVKRDRLKQELDEQWHDGHVISTELKISEIKQKYKTEKGAASAIARIEPGVDYNSPKQMLWLLKEYLGYDCTLIEEKVSDKTGKVTTEGTGAEVLERLANEGKEDVRKFLDYREVNKILTSYFPTYRELQVGGTLHPIFNPDSTVTGRTSSERPNLQQVPSSISRLFTARPGFKIISYDAAAIEPKIICQYTSDPRLYTIISKGDSIHDYNANVYFELGGPDFSLKRVKAEYPTHRGAAKEVGLSLFYHAGGRRIRTSFAKWGFHISDFEAKSKHKRFKEEFSHAMSVVREFVDLFEAGEVIPNLFGRPIKIQNPEDAYMKGFNRLVQSSASDLNLEAALRTQNECDTLGLDVHYLGTEHDKNIFEARNEHADQAEKILVKHMTGFNLICDLGPIPLEVEGGQMEVGFK